MPPTCLRIQATSLSLVPSVDDEQVVVVAELVDKDVVDEGALGG